MYDLKKRYQFWFIIVNLEKLLIFLCKFINDLYWYKDRKFIIVANNTYNND